MRREFARSLRDLYTTSVQNGMSAINLLLLFPHFPVRMPRDVWANTSSSRHMPQVDKFHFLWAALHVFLEPRRKRN